MISCRNVVRGMVWMLSKLATQFVPKTHTEQIIRHTKLRQLDQAVMSRGEWGSVETLRCQ